MVSFRLLLLTTLLVSSSYGQFCGNLTLPLSSTQKNVLVLGDSISMAVPYTPGGYGVNLIELLTPHNVFTQHAGGWFSGAQCSNTVKGLECTNTSFYSNYLNFTGGKQFDVITFNYGLHDLVNCTDNPECSEHVDIDVYGQNILTIYNRLAQFARNVIWVSTTPVPNVTTSLGRSYELSVLYNAEALSVLKNTKAYVCDLWTGVIKYCGAYYTSCDLQIPQNVHFLPKGQAFLGNLVANSILQVINT